MYNDNLRLPVVLLCTSPIPNACRWERVVHGDLDVAVLAVGGARCARNDEIRQKAMAARAAAAGGRRTVDDGDGRLAGKYHFEKVP